jgi:DNA (cytosine-5)-methyltransferase 1
MRHGSLFSGIGGFDLAAEWMGWENVFHCEWNPFGQKILHHYWPNAIQYHDITKTDFSVHRGTIDILTGGFPCQPYSMAGKRLGKEDDRHLWPEMLRAIREIQPKWVVGENVYGLVNWNDGLVFHEVQTDLEAEGYEVQPYVLSAASVNAPHLRQRVWFVAYSGAFRLQQCETPRTMGEGQEKICGEGNQSSLQSSATSQVGDAADTKSEGSWEFPPKDSGRSDGRFNNISQKRIAADTANKGLQRGEVIRGIGGIGQNGNKFPSGCVPPNWEEFPTQSPICSGDDGLPTRLDGITFSKWRNESIKGYGNAVVPQVVHQIFKTISLYESTSHETSNP